MTQDEKELLELARAEFDDLGPAEIRMFVAATRREKADFRIGDPDQDDVAKADGWGDDRVIRADRLMWLCTDPVASRFVTPVGITVAGVRVDGTLDLNYSNIPFPLRVMYSAFPDEILLVDSKTRRLSFSSSVVAGINAEGIEVDGTVFLQNGFVAKGEVNFLAARIRGSLQCDGGQFQNSIGYALNANGIEVNGSVWFQKGFVARGEVNLTNAHIEGNLQCDGGLFENLNGKALNAGGIEVDGDVFLHNGFIAKGEVSFLGAHIGGTLACNGGRFENPGGAALTADRLEVGGSVFLSVGFIAKGEVRLLGAHIGSNLDCGAGQFENPGGTALTADRLEVGGVVFLRDSFVAKGEVRLLGAHIGSNLECDGGRFENPDGQALTADGIEVDGGVFLQGGFVATGEVRLLGAHIRGQLSCRGGHFENPDGEALYADGIEVLDAVYLSEGFVAKGQVSFVGAQFGSTFECDGGRFENPGGWALKAEGIVVGGSVFFRDGFNVLGGVGFFNASITGTFTWRDMSDDSKISLNLAGARVGNLHDDENHWPSPGSLDLDGFTYDRIDNRAPTDAVSRIEWLRLVAPAKFSPQPYTQLAKVYRESGHEEQAKQVLIALEKDRKERTALTLGQKFWYYVGGWTIGYGQRPWRALWIASVFMLFGALMFRTASHHGVMMPEDKIGQRASAPDPGGWTVDPRFNSILYSVDAFVPLMKFHQADYWLPDPTVPWGAACRYYLWFHTAMGWLLSTLLAVGLSGLVSR